VRKGKLLEMKKYESLDPIDRYMKEINKLLPYPDSKKEPILTELKKDVRDAMGSDKRPPSVVYGSPKEVAINISIAQDWETKTAGWGKRTLAFIIDFSLLSFILLLFIFYPLLTVLERPAELSDRIIFIAGMNLLIGIPSLLFILGYFIISETYYSTTLGKKIFGLIVTDESGIRITISQSLIRNFTKVPFTGQFLIFDVLIGIFSEKTRKNKQRVLDLVAGTKVVQQN
jgi:uncharacterized RDD family membrane protein YckC